MLCSEKGNRVASNWRDTVVRWLEFSGGWLGLYHFLLMQDVCVCDTGIGAFFASSAVYAMIGTTAE